MNLSVKGYHKLVQAIKHPMREFLNAFRQETSLKKMLPSFSFERRIENHEPIALLQDSQDDITRAMAYCMIGATLGDAIPGVIKRLLICNLAKLDSKKDLKCSKKEVILAK